MLSPGLSASTELLPSEEKVLESLPIWKVTEIVHGKVVAKLAMDRDTLAGTQYKERSSQPITDWTDLPPAVQQQHIDAAIFFPP